MITKGGLNSATQNLAIEYAKDGIRFDTVAPAKWIHRCRQNEPGDSMLQPAMKKATVNDIVDAVLYLAQAGHVNWRDTPRGWCRSGSSLVKIKDSNHTYTTSKRGPPRDEPAGQAWIAPPAAILLGGWRCGARLTASQMRTHQKLRRPYRGQMRVHFTIWPKRPAASDHEDRRRRKCESERPPTGAGAAMRPGLLRPAYRAQYARALHNMREAAGGLRARRPTREDLEGQAQPSIGTANAVRPALRPITASQGREKLRECRPRTTAATTGRDRTPGRVREFPAVAADSDSNHIDARAQVTVCCAYRGDHTPVAGAFKLVEA